MVGISRTGLALFLFLCSFFFCYVLSENKNTAEEDIPFQFQFIGQMCTCARACVCVCVCVCVIYTCFMNDFLRSIFHPQNKGSFITQDSKWPCCNSNQNCPHKINHTYCHAGIILLWSLIFSVMGEVLSHGWNIQNWASPYFK